MTAPLTGNGGAIPWRSQLCVGAPWRRCEVVEFYRDDEDDEGRCLLIVVSAVTVVSGVSDSFHVEIHLAGMMMRMRIIIDNHHD